jgi:hypothetical protein
MKKIILFFAVMMPIELLAQSWNPFAPRDYNDCILKNLKEGMREDAVRAVQFACTEKYPTPEDKSIASGLKALEARKKKCKYKDEFTTNHTFIGIELKRNQQVTQAIINKIKSLKLENNNLLHFQNMNNFGLSGLSIGFINAKQCPLDISSYNYTTNCFSDKNNGVAPTSYGGLPCGSLPPEAKSMPMCVIGFSPIYPSYGHTLLEFLEDNGYCNF